VGPIDVDEPLDLTRFIRSGDMVVWGQACAEPRSLTRLLVQQADQIGDVRCFVGIPAQSMVTVATVGSLNVHSYCGSGTNSGLHSAGRLNLMPVHYSTLPDLLERGTLKADVVLVQVSPADEDGFHCLGLADDYFSGTVETARVVLAEVNDHVPFTCGARTIHRSAFAAVVRSAESPGEMPTPDVDGATRAVADNVASIVENGATLQFGIGALPEAVLGALVGHRDLGIHSGIINDTAMRLITEGVANGTRKAHDVGVAIGGLFGGSADLFAWAHRNPAVELRSTRYTHDPEILRTSHRMTAINAAIEVDLTGQVNAEVAAGRYVGAVGGAIDFLRGAAGSPNGLPVVALPARTREAPRIVSRLNGPVSTPRAEQFVVVTDWGVADLRGLTVEQRVERMISVAHPDDRKQLDADADLALASA
jgi:acyl-CoA hydrolase